MRIFFYFHVSLKDTVSSNKCKCSLNLPPYQVEGCLSSVMTILLARNGRVDLLMKGTVGIPSLSRLTKNVIPLGAIERGFLVILIDILKHYPMAKAEHLEPIQRHQCFGV